MAAVPQPKLENYVFTKKIGSGSFATVYKAYKKLASDRQVVAIKCIKKSSLNKTSVDNLMKEIEILKNIKHENIVKLIDFQWDSSYIYLIMEFCGGGDLSHLIKAKRKLPEFVVKRFLQQIAGAMKVLYNNQIAHFDLKPHNILLTSSKQPLLKLADFGFAQHIREETPSSEVDRCKFRGSPLYMAPEIILQKPYDAKADLWSIGVILYESLFGRAPYASSTIDSLLEKFINSQPITIPTDQHISTECGDLLTRLLHHSPQHRISFQEFFTHEFVDLEHRPSAQCISKAVELVSKAVKADGSNNMEEASRLYNQAIRYFVPAIYYENDVEVQERLRVKVKEYCNRAEEIQQSLHRGGDQHTTVTVAADSNQNKQGERKNYLLQMSLAKDERLYQGLVMLYQASDQELIQNYDESLRLYGQSFDVLLPLAAKQPKLLQRLLHAELKTHLARYEVLDAYVKEQQQANVTENRNDDDNCATVATTTTQETDERATSTFSKCVVQ